MAAPAFAAADDVVTKGEFAALSNVSPGRVSQWIAEGKISGAALVGEGRGARIRVSAARAQLRQKIDIGQRFGNGLDTRLGPAAQPPVTTLTDEAEPSDPLEEQIKRARLREIEFRNTTAAEAELARRGLYVLASAAQAEMAGLATGMLNVFEGALADFATAIASKFQLPQRDVLHLLRAEFREVRIRSAAAARDKAADLPPLIAADEAAVAGDD